MWSKIDMTDNYIRLIFQFKQLKNGQLRMSRENSIQKVVYGKKDKITGWRVTFKYQS